MAQVRARQSFQAPGGLMVRLGDVFEDSDPIVKGREALFSPVSETVRTTVADVEPKKRARRPKPKVDAEDGDDG